MASCSGPVAQTNALSDSERGLRSVDESEIARQLRAINAVGVRHGIKVVFIVPPVYETDRRDSVVSQIFNRALAQVPDLAVIDNRNIHADPSYFESSLHPSPLYWRLVVDELRRRSFIK